MLSHKNLDEQGIRIERDGSQHLFQFLALEVFCTSSSCAQAPGRVTSADAIKATTVISRLINLITFFVITPPFPPTGGGKRIRGQKLQAIIMPNTGRLRSGA